MEDENLKGSNPPAKDGQPDKKPFNNMAIVGYNLLALAGYTLLSRFSEDGIILDALIMAGQILVCIIAAIAYRSWFWLLSALMVLIVGVSSCVYLLNS